MKQTLLLLSNRKSHITLQVAYLLWNLSHTKNQDQGQVFLSANISVTVTDETYITIVIKYEIIY